MSAAKFPLSLLLVIDRSVLWPGESTGKGKLSTLDIRPPACESFEGILGMGGLLVLRKDHFDIVLCYYGAGRGEPPRL